MAKTCRKIRPVVAIDLGSNSFHLIRADVIDGQVHVRHRAKQRVRLSSGLNHDRRIDDEAIARGLSALAIFQEHLDGCAPDSVRVVGTHTLREARNAKEFLKAAKSVIDHPIEIISGAEEGRITYQGVAFSEHVSGSTLLIDIGGGSTELVLGDGGDVKDVASRSMGCVVFQSRFFESGISKQGFKNARNEAYLVAEMVQPRFRGFDKVLGSSGSIKAISQCNKAFFHSPEITLQSLSEIELFLRTMSGQEFTSRAAISKERYQVLPAGVAILQGVLSALEIDRVVATRGALREGLLAGFLSGPSAPFGRDQTVVALQSRYGIDRKHASRVKAVAESFASALGVTQTRVFNLLANACDLHEIGQAINYSDHQEHGRYLLNHSDLPGYHWQDQQTLASLVGMQRKSLSSFEALSTQEKAALSALRLAVLFLRARQNIEMPRLDHTTLALPKSLAWLEKDVSKELKRLTVLGVFLRLSRLD